MLIKCWGSRGSIPVSGKDYIKYGGDTTCIEIRGCDGRVIIIDAGTGIRSLGNVLQRESCRTVELFFTHVHWDHIFGFPFFRPIYSADFEIRIHCPYSINIEKVLEHQMVAPFFPVTYDQTRANLTYLHDGQNRIELGSISVEPIPLSHPNRGAGYQFVENGKCFVFMTDNELGYVHKNGLSSEAYRDFCAGADLLFHDAEYTEKEYKKFRTWGHSSYMSALDLAISANVKRLGLFHFNQERADQDIDEMVADCRTNIIQAGSSLECFGVNCGYSIQL